MRRARVRALQRRESVNAYLAEMLRRYADDGEAQEEVFTKLAEIADAVDSGSDGERRTWTRDDLHRV